MERLGTVYRDNNKDAAAIDTFRKMLALGDDNAERGYQQLIDTYREAKQWQQATDAAKEAGEIAQGPRPKDGLRRATCRHGPGRRRPAKGEVAC